MVYGTLLSENYVAYKFSLLTLMSTPYENRVFHHEINTNHNLTRTWINNQHQKYCDKKKKIKLEICVFWSDSPKPEPNLWNFCCCYLSYIFFSTTKFSTTLFHNLTNNIIHPTFIDSNKINRLFFSARETELNAFMTVYSTAKCVNKFMSFYHLNIHF